MRLSKNPTTGEVECYTDIGQYIGVLPKDYPIAKRSSAKDVQDSLPRLFIEYFKTKGGE